MHEVDDETIQKYAKLMKEYNLSGIEITEGNVSVRLEQQPCSQQKEVIPIMPNISDVTAAQISAAVSGAFPAVQAADNTAASSATSTQTASNIIEVKSPIVGVFYAAPTEDSDPYVQVGDTVKAGNTLCIVEAMKLMNEITADEIGVVKEICLKDGAPVEFGTPLFWIEPVSAAR